jgi:3-methyl-2-oxobutanoate hydroxymethyltransferase
MITLGEAVRRGAPNVYLVGDMPYEAMGSDTTAVAAARRFCEEAGCDAVKFEAAPEHDTLVSKLAGASIQMIVHLGLQPQSVTSPDGYRAQARDGQAIEALVAEARRMVAVGADMLLLEAVPSEASQAVVEAVDVPVIGCGAGPACDGHVVVTQDMLGIGATRAPRFVPVFAHLGRQMEDAMRRWVQSIADGSYPGPEHVYRMRKQPAAPPTA